MRRSIRSSGYAAAAALGAAFWVGTASAADGADSQLGRTLDAIVANERQLAVSLERYRPLVETYIQTVEPDPTLGSSPVKDYYFFGRLELGTPAAAPSERKRERRAKKDADREALSLFEEFHSQTFRPEGFARMLLVDRGSFDRETYDFEFLRAEFLGEVRTLVFDVTPKPGRALKRLKTGEFTGRIWVEDRGFHIVRFNGIYASILTSSFHFDSWRMNLAPGLWLPAYVYTEEPDRSAKQLDRTHRGQTRIWGYDVARPDSEDEFTQVLVDSPQARDASESGGPISPVESARAWEREAEANVIRRLERSGLLAPEGALDKVLETVLTNLVVTSGLDIDPPIRCRVLLTTPLESFTIGRTVVISRGLLDVLPDEASLAMVLAHELGHVLSGHRLDTKYAFSDRVLVADREALEQFEFRRDPAEERQADDRAVALLETSPYKDKLQGPGLFLRALAANARSLPSLIRPHFGSALAESQAPRMERIASAAPALDPAALGQIAALPLGGRVKLDPWSARVELIKAARVPLLSPREKMAFQVTPLMPFLAHHPAEGDAVARK